MQDSKLYVGNFNYSVTNEQLEEMFSNHDEVRQVKIIEGKGFGFVEMSNQCGMHDRLPDGDRAQIRAEIDAYVAHLYGLSQDDFAYILDTFPVLKKKEEKAFGEFMSKRKCLEEYDRVEKVLNGGRA